MALMDTTRPLDNYQGYGHEKNNWVWEQSGHHPTDSPCAQARLPPLPRYSQVARYMARPRMLPGRVSLRSTSSVRPCIRRPLLSLLFHGSQTLHSSALRYQRHTYNRRCRHFPQPLRSPIPSHRCRDLQDTPQCPFLCPSREQKVVRILWHYTMHRIGLVGPD